MIAWTDARVADFAAGRVVVVDDAIDEPLRAAVDAAIVGLEAAGALRPAGVGRDGVVRPEVRGDRLAWLDDLVDVDPALAALDARFAALGDATREALWIGLVGRTVQVATYAPGSAYAAHRDAFAGRSARRVTAVLYVHGAWSPGDGGELRVHADDGVVDLAPQPRRLVVFAADRVRHEVLPTRVRRAAVTAWYRDRPEA